MQNRGVKVEIVTARNRDQPIYKSLLNSDLFLRLHSKGAVVHEEPFKYLHMKAIEVDEGASLTLGSLNQDHWSFYVNNEANLLVRNMIERQNWKAHQQFSRIFQNLQRECRPVNFSESYGAGGYIEVTFWKMMLSLAHLVGNNRD